MNNEETIIMQPKNNDKAQQSQNVETPKEEKKSNTGKRVAAATTAGVFGGAAGGAGAAYAASMINTDEPEKQEVEAKVDEAPAKAEHQETPASETEAATAQPEEVQATVDENGETDYTGNHGADIAATPAAQHAASSTSGSDSNDGNEVQVLGVYESEGENGQTMEAALLTDGNEVAAVVDVDGDGMVDALLVDSNQNQQIDEGEVYDVSSEHVQMSQYEDAYLAQQQEQIGQEEQDTYAYDTDYDQDFDQDIDYNNDADIYDV